MNNENPTDVILWTNTDDAIITIAVGLRSIVQSCFGFILAIQSSFSSF